MHTVARGPVPRDRATCAKTTRRPKPFPVLTEAWRGTGPRPTVKRGSLAYRSAGPVPRDRATCAKTTRRPRPFPVSTEARRGTGPRPTMKGSSLAYRSAGACPPRSLDCADDGEGNPLGCACGIRGPKPYDEGAPIASRPGGLSYRLNWLSVTTTIGFATVFPYTDLSTAAAATCRDAHQNARTLNSIARAATSPCQ